MKRFLCAAFTIFLVLGVISIAHASVDSVYEAKVTKIKGNVKVDAKGSGTWISPWVGLKLKEEAVIETGSGSFIEIVFDAKGKNILKIKENSRVTVKEASIDLLGGSILANFADLKPMSSFVVRTPTAVCGVRGSGMGVDFIQGMTVVMAFEDKVYVQGLDAKGNPVGKEVIIPEGWKAQVKKGGTIEPPAELTENERKIWDAWVEFIAEAPPEEAELEEEPAEPERPEGSEYR